jgi:hypothetical protein
VVVVVVAAAVVVVVGGGAGGTLCSTHGAYLAQMAVHKLQKHRLLQDQADQLSRALLQMGSCALSQESGSLQ